MSKRNKQFTPRNKNVAKPQPVPMKDVRQASIEEFMQVAERLHYCIGRLQASYVLFSIANVYVEEITELMLKYGIYLPHIKRNAQAIAKAFDLFKNEMNKLFQERGDKKEFSEFIAEFQSDIEKMLHLDVDEENLRKAEMPKLSRSWTTTKTSWEHISSLR